MMNIIHHLYPIIGDQVMLSIDSMQSHVKFLARKHRIVIDTFENLPLFTKEKVDKNEEGYGGASLPGIRRIFVIPIFDEISYFTQLHELGHIVTNDEKRFDLVEERALNLGTWSAFINNEDYFKQSWELHRKNVLDMEIAATTWAAQNALEFTPAMQKASTKAYYSYVRGYGEAVAK